MQHTAQSWVVWELSHSGPAFGIAAVIGPALAGWGIGYLGVASAFWINGVTFLAVIASLLAIRGSQIRRTSTGRPLQEFREGLAFLRKETRAQDLLAFSVMVTFFGISSIIILPAVVSLVLGGGADMLGFLLASSGAGALPAAALLIGIAADAFTPMGAILLNGALMIVAAGALVGLRSGLLSWEARATIAGASAGPPAR